MDLELKGKRALVTGGSRGIGRAIVEALAAEGARVAICARGAPGVNDAVTAMRAKGADVVGEALDVRDPDALGAWVQRAAEAMGGLDIVVSNVSTRVDPQGPDWWRESFDADLMQHVRLKGMTTPLMADGGAFVFIASIAATLATVPPYEEAYGAMKAGLVALVGQWAQALGGRSIRVNAVSPGPIDFPGGWWDKVKVQNPQAHARAGRLAALGRLGSPDEVAAAVAFLASPRAGFITGANLRIDGGLLKTANF